MSAFETVSGVLLGLGTFFCITGGVGLLRLPDFYSRAHAGGLPDTLGATLILAGLVLLAGPNLIAVKLVMVGVLLHVTSPTGAHALAKAAYSRGVRAEEDAGE